MSKPSLDGLQRVLPCLPFVVDTFEPDVNPTPKPQFLTHAHKDHTIGIDVHGRSIHTTTLTRDLVLLKFPGLKDTATFQVLELGHPTHVRWGAHSFTVIALSSVHCPGSCSYIFQGSFGTIVHTGDARLTSESVAMLHAALEGTPVDLLYVDCTFGKSHYVS
jgi:DNA cross-link repair 1A protein